MAEKGAAFLKANGKEDLLRKVSAKSRLPARRALRRRARPGSGIVLAHPSTPSSART
jgi:hypothetical protein